MRSGTSARSMASSVWINRAEACSSGCATASGQSSVELNTDLVLHHPAFTRRFETMERLAAERGHGLNGQDVEALDALWEAAKSAE